MFGSAGTSCLAIVGNRGLFETQPTSQAGDEAVAFGEFVHLLDDDAIHQAEYSGVGAGGESAQTLQKGIKKFEPPAAWSGFGAGGALGDHDLKSLGPLADQLRNQFRWILQIAIHQHDAFAGSEMDPGGQRGLMTEIAGEADGSHAIIDGVKFANELRGSIETAIIHINDLPRIVGGIEGGGQSAMKLG